MIFKEEGILQNCYISLQNVFFFMSMAISRKS